MSMKSRIEVLVEDFDKANSAKLTYEEKRDLAARISNLLNTAFEKPVCTKEEYETLKADAEKYKRDMLDECRKTGLALWALERIGVPDLSSPHFDAYVDHIAVKLGRFKPA